MTDALSMTDRSTHGSPPAFDLSAFLKNRVGPGAIYVWLLAFVLVPNLLLVFTSLMKSSGGAVVYEPTLANYISVVGSATVQVLALKTVVVAAISALLATAVAYPLAFYISRNLTKSKTTAAMLIVIPLWISLLMRIFAWRVILGERGVLNTLLINAGVIETPSSLFLYTPLSVILTLTSVAIPYVFVAAYTAIERVPFSLIEAARDNGASNYRTFTKIVWPLTRQGTAIGIALAFLMAIGDYVTPSMVGGLNGTMLGMVISSQFGMAGNWPLGSALAIYILVLVVVCLAVLFVALRSRGVLTEVDAGVKPIVKQWRELDGAQKVRRLFGRVLFLLPYVVLYAPLVVITLFSFNDSTVQSLPFKGFTLKWYQDLPQNGALLAALFKSLELAVIVTALAVVIGTAFSFLLVNWTGRFASAAENLIALPLAVPGVVLGISMVMAASAAGVAPGMGRLVIGHLVFVMPVVMLVVTARLKRIDPSFALAARDLGAGWWTAFWKIQFPMVRSAVVGGALLGFTISVDEVVVSLFLTGAEPTLPVYVWNQTRFGFTPSVNAIFAVIGAVSLMLVLFAQALINPDSKRTN
ncbi:ABC transporter permease subunit [Pararhizobium sp.]|uniref:ABC transporter permease subunit n=1 Tax=Pararhizobium sp. TaxID=1977563 RepID=UPI00271C7F6D|nr:ABC transporter permease subunit [Pararhizobium sp.]MDO9418054.1 ABC transporter permease subunit [Pararhizobium sp.]